MDQINEKKWFVYLGDHHEGPFSVAEVQDKLERSEISAAHYVWRKGMADWQPFNQVGELKPLLQPPPEETAVFNSNSFQLDDDEDRTDPRIQTQQPLDTVSADQNPFEGVPVEAVAVEEVELGPLDAEGVTELEGDAVPTASVEHSDTYPTRKKKRSNTKLLLLLLLGLLGYAHWEGYLDPVIKQIPFHKLQRMASDFIRPHIEPYAKKFPILQEVFSPIPKLYEVSDNGYDELRKVAALNLSTHGPAVGTALGLKDIRSPYFYIGSNMPDGTKFDIFVVGLPETLLNHIRFLKIHEVVLKQGIAKTPIIEFEDSRPIPRGEYAVIVTDSERQISPAEKAMESLTKQMVLLPKLGQVERKIIYRKNYFLGGEKDENYQVRLKVFHDKLRAKARAEVNELKQFHSTLVSQLEKSSSNFKKIQKIRSPSRRKVSWKKFSQGWTKFQAQLDKTFQIWNEPEQKKKFLYSDLYAQMGGLGNEISNLQSLRNSFFLGKMNSRQYQTQSSEVMRQISALESSLRNKVYDLEKNPLDPTGLPRMLHESK